MAGCGCSGYSKNPLSGGCSDKARSKNIARLIREGYPASQAVAIAYSTQRKAGCKVKRGMTKNPPYGVYAVSERLLEVYPGLAEAVEQAHGAAGTSGYKRVVVYDQGRQDRGRKGEFIAMFRPNKKKSKGAKKAMYRSNRAGRFDAAGIREDANVALAEVIDKRGMPAAMKIIRRVFGADAPVAGTESLNDLKALRAAAEAEIGHMVPNKRRRKGKRKYKANVSNPMMPLLLTGAALGAIAYFLFAAKQPGSEEDAFKTGGGSLGPGVIPPSTLGPFKPR